MNTTEQNAGSAANAGNPSGTPSGEPPVNNGTGVSPDAGWTSGLLEAENREIAAAKGWDKSKSADVVIKSYRDLESRLGKSIVLPTAESPKEDHDKLYTALGRPAQPDGYAFKLPEGVPENLPYDDAFATKFKGWAHKADLAPRQAQSIHDDFVRNASAEIQSSQEAQSRRVVAAHQEIQRKWGEAGTVGYTRALELATRALRKLGLVDSYKAAGLVTANGEITDAKVAFALHETGKGMFAEDSVHGGPGTLTASNPWKDGAENLTEQGRIVKENPDQARALIIAAGKNPDDVLFKKK